MLRYVQPVYRPPSESDALILQATLGCSWNQCTYCDMYRSKSFSVRPLPEVIQELRTVGAVAGDSVRKLFVADGDALVMDLDTWGPILEVAAEELPNAKRVSCYATADALLDKGLADLQRLVGWGLTRVYIGPESGDEQTLRRLAKGPRRGADRDTHYLVQRHVEASQLARQAGMEVSAIFLLGAGGVERSEAHAHASAALATAMDPHFLAALTLTIVPGTPLAKTAERLGFRLPELPGLFAELRTLVDECRPTDALFRTNHASNHLPLGGRLPRDRERIVAVIDEALAGRVRLRPEWARGL